MTKTARIIIDIALPEGFEVEQHALDALDDLASIMAIQGEDGLYTGGYKEGEDADWITDWGTFSSGRSFTSSVTLVDLDDETSASRQHWIDTGRYLPKHCVNCEDGVCHHLDDDPDRITDLYGNPTI